ncbi:hypothetical protein M885DRAFT_611376 [Pelagophyceae sp. CCMP2097]|nr:hypothetical protein M885DRAFT_611376 [Pelagophyceae sp. CCMP2097]
MSGEESAAYLTVLGPLFAVAASSYAPQWEVCAGKVVASAVGEVLLLHVLRRRDGLAAAYASEQRAAPEFPEPHKNAPEHRGWANAVSPSAPEMFRIGDCVPLMYRERDSRRTRDAADYEALQRAATAGAREERLAASRAAQEQRAARDGRRRPREDWSNEDRAASGKAPSADAPPWMARVRDAYRAKHASDDAADAPRPRTTGPAGPPPVPALALGPRDAAAASLSARDVAYGNAAAVRASPRSAALDDGRARERRHFGQAEVRRDFAESRRNRPPPVSPREPYSPRAPESPRGSGAAAVQPASAPARPVASVGPAASAGTLRVLSGAPSVFTPSWFAHQS